MTDDLDMAALSAGIPDGSSDTAKQEQDHTPAGLFMVKGQLQVGSLARALRAQVPMAHDLGDAIWVYHGGVWRPDVRGLVRTAVVAALGEQFRDGHLTNTEQTIRGSTPVLEPTPNPRFINTTNGMLDWATGELTGHDPDQWSTVQLPVQWVPAATCKATEEWLAQVLPSDLLAPTPDGPGFVWELFGYLVVEGNPLHKAVLLLGKGRNGKGTFIRLVRALLGRENTSEVTLHDLTSNRFMAAELLGKIANLAGDLDGGWLDSTAAFKAVTGGDTLQAERKFGQPFSFTPHAVHVYSANRVWGTPDTSDGYLSRWVVVPFPNSFSGREDRSLDQRLAVPDELEGLLVRAVAGARSLHARGNFTAPPSVADAFRRFEDASDPVRLFLRETTQRDGTTWITRKELREVYQAWSTENGSAAMRADALYERLEAAGLRPAKRDGVRGFVGVRLTVLVTPDGFGGSRLLSLREDQ